MLRLLQMHLAKRPAGNTLRSRSPLTGTGSVLVITAVVLATSGVIQADVYRLGAGLSLLIFVLLNAAYLYILPVDRYIGSFSWNFPATFVSGRINTEHRMSFEGISPPAMTRFLFSHSVREGSSTQVYRIANWTERSTGAATPQTHLPGQCGILTWNVTPAIGDLFGLAQRRITEQTQRQAVIIPEPASIPMEIDSLARTEEKNRSTRHREGEKILIRDYQPGDLPRDINWKASGRLRQLLTRIPPESQSPTRHLRLCLIADPMTEKQHRWLADLHSMKQLAAIIISQQDNIQPTIGNNENEAEVEIEVHLNGIPLNPPETEMASSTLIRGISQWFPSSSPDMRDIQGLFTPEGSDLWFICRNDASAAALSRLATPETVIHRISASATTFSKKTLTAGDVDSQQNSDKPELPPVSHWRGASGIPIYLPAISLRATLGRRRRNIPAGPPNGSVYPGGTPSAATNDIFYREMW